MLWLGVGPPTTHTVRPSLPSIAVARRPPAGQPTSSGVSMGTPLCGRPASRPPMDPINRRQSVTPHIAASRQISPPSAYCRRRRRSTRQAATRHYLNVTVSAVVLCERRMIYIQTECEPCDSRVVSAGRRYRRGHRLSRVDIATVPVGDVARDRGRAAAGGVPSPSALLASRVFARAASAGAGFARIGAARPPLRLVVRHRCGGSDEPRWHRR